MQSCLITLPGDFTCRFALGEGGLKTDDSHVCHTHLQRAVSFSNVVAKLDNNSLPLLQCFFFFFAYFTYIMASELYLQFLS